MPGSAQVPVRAEVKGQSGGRVGGGFHLGDLLKTENEISGNARKSRIWPYKWVHAQVPTWDGGEIHCTELPYDLKVQYI